MFAFLEGTVEILSADGLVINVQGVGFELAASTKTLAALRKGERARVLTHLHLAEGLMALYGFADEQERSMFRRLISISRVGPKLALAALSTMKPSELATAIVCEDDSMLARVPGLGKKTAQRIILELREKISQETDMGSLVPFGGGDAGADGDLYREATAALVALGYDGSIATRAVHSVETTDDLQVLITQALKCLAR